MPEQFQDAFNSQHYLQAATILVDAVDKLYQDDLLRIGALVELQAEIVAKKNTFHEVALELLHNLIYLKDSPELGEEFGDVGGASTSMQSSTTSTSNAGGSGANAGSAASGGASASNAGGSAGGKSSSAPGGANASSTPITMEFDPRTKTLVEKDPLTVKLELMEQLVSAFFVLGKSSQAINKILERLRSELRHIIQKAVATVKKRHESNPVLLQQILSRPNRGPHAHDYPNLFLDMLQIVFSKAKEVLIFHRCVTEFFDTKMREQQQMEEGAARSGQDEDGARRPKANGRNRGSSLLGPNGGSNTGNTGTLGVDGGRSSIERERRDSMDSSSNVTTSTYRLDHVWEEFQKELQALIGYFIAAPSESTAIVTGKKQSLDLPHQGVRLFSFSNSSAFTLYEVSETQSFTYRNMDLGDPSPYNLPSLYPLVSNFCELGTQIVSTRAMASSRLQEWMDNFIATTLLSVVKMDYKSRVESALQGAEAFKSRDSKLVKAAYSPDEGRRPLLNSAIEVFQCVKELYEDSVAMPLYSVHIHGIMDSCLMSYYEASKAKYDEYIRDSEVGKTVKNSEFQKLVLTDPQWRRLLRQFKLGGAVSTNTTTLAGSADSTSSDSAPGSGKVDIKNEDMIVRSAPSFSAATSLIRGGSSISDGHGSAGLVDAEETEFTANLMDFESAWHTGTTNAGFPITGRHMIMDPSRLVNLAALHDSTYWIADRVAFLERMDIFTSPSSLASGSIIGGALGISSMISGNNPSVNSSGKVTRDGVLKSTAATPSNARRMQRRDSKEQFQQSSTIFRPKLSSALTNLTWMFKDLSDQCLHNIYVDFRLQTCFFLDGLNKNYVYAAEDRMPDQRVVDLNTSLANAYIQLQAYLPATKLRYLLGGLPTLMSALLVESLKSHIEAINRNGVVKMIRNIFTLQQNLTGMTTFNEAPFDKARRYYELLGLNLEEVYAFITQHHHAEDQGSYTLNQYRTILELIANPKSRTLTDEQEKDLRDKFVLVPYPADSFKRPVK